MEKRLFVVRKKYSVNKMGGLFSTINAKVSKMKERVYRYNVQYLYMTYPLRKKYGMLLKSEKKFLKLENTALTNACFVIGNGPSLSCSDLERIKDKGYPCFASNKIYKVFDQTDWRPDYYACVDKLMLEQNIDDILDVDLKIKFINAIAATFAKNIQDFYQVRFVKDGALCNNGAYMRTRGSVTTLMIHFALLMGYRTIYLIGCDHSYNFYNSNVSAGQIVVPNADIKNDYFIKDYMKPNEKMNIGNMDKVEEGYIEYKGIAESVGAHIYNATRGGKLEVFERVNLDELLNA